MLAGSGTDADEPANRAVAIASGLAIMLVKVARWLLNALSMSV
jgi:hypothetical protein